MNSLSLSPAARPQSAEQPAPERALQSPLAAFHRRRLLFTGIVVAFLSLVIVATMLSPKSYTTHVRFIAGSSGGLQQDTSGNQTILPVLNAILNISDAQSTETYAEIIQQRAVLDRVIAHERLGITAKDFAGHLAVKPVTNTAILDVAVTWSSAARSASIANDLAAQFVNVRRDLITEQATSALRYIGAQLPAAREKMQRSDAALAAYETVHGVADPTAQTQAVITQLSGIESKLSQVQVDHRQAVASLQNEQQQLDRVPRDVDSAHQVAFNPVAAELRSQLAQVSVQLHDALAQYTERHPTVRALRQREANLRKELASVPLTIDAQRSITTNPLRQALEQNAAVLRAQIASDAAQESELDAQRSRLLPVIRALPAQAAKLVALQRTAKQDEAVYNALEQKYEQANVARTTTLSDISIIAWANAADAVAHPNVLMNTAVGFMLALFLGIAGVFAAEHFDRSVKTESDVVDRLGMPVLATVPQLAVRGRTPHWLQATVIDSFLQLLTALRFASSERMRTIAVTSGDERDGKSLIALHTATALAELEPRVLLIDADLRLPSLHTKMGLARDPGLSDVLVGCVSLDGAVRSTAHAGLDFLSAGTAVPNPFALLQSPAFERLIDEARTRYQAVILDTPACASVVDAAVVCGRADGTVYVVASHETDLHQAERGLSRLRSAGVRNVVGAVLNKATPQASTIGAYGRLESGRRALPLPPARPDPHAGEASA